jgi:hypothetical protein
MIPTAIFKRGPIRVGRYDLSDAVGTGRAGPIYRGTDRDTGQPVAVRVLRPWVTADKSLLARVFEEFRAVADLDHPNIVRALDCGTDGPLSYLVTEFVEGTSLRDLLERTGRLSEPTAIRTITHVAQGLDHAHRKGVYHTSVRPGAVLVRPDGFAKLAGFGLPRDLGEEPNSRVLLPSPFTAPEQIADAGAVGVRADLYSVAATLFAAVTGNSPRRSDKGIPSPREMARDVSDQLDRAVRRAMSPLPARRPGSCLSFVRQLPVQKKADRAAKPAPVHTPAPRFGEDRRGAVRRVCALATACVVDTDVFDGGAAEETWPAALRDVSVTGVGLVLARRFEPGTMLAIETGQEEPHPRVFAQVVRVLPDEVGHWFHGCAFDRRLSERELAALQ